MRCLRSLAVLAALAAPLASRADTINLSTGFATYTVVAPAGSSCPNFDGSTCFVTPVDQNPGWSDLIANAIWVDASGTSDNGPDNPNGPYVFTTTFTTSDWGILSGSFESDNAGTLYVDGSSTALASNGNFEFTTDFSTYLAAGTHTLTFDVLNGDLDPDSGDGPNDFGPVGLLVGANVDIAPTPEPSSLMLLGTGILGVGGLTRRKLLQK